MERVKLLGIEVDNVTMDEALTEMSRLIESGGPHYVVTPNLDHIVKLDQDAEFREVYAHASLVLADGAPLIWLSRLRVTPIKEKVSGSDLFPRLCGMAAKKGYTMFFLGAAEGVAATAAENLKARYPGLNVVGTYSPKLGFEQDPDEMAHIIRIVREASPDILIVGLGAPKQDKFAYRHRAELGVPLLLGLGASLDFEAGVLKRAPAWMSRCGLEWFFRMCQDPKRLVKRYLVDDMRILSIAWKHRNR